MAASCFGPNGAVWRRAPGCSPSPEHCVDVRWGPRVDSRKPIRDDAGIGFRRSRRAFIKPIVSAWYQGTARQHSVPAVVLPAQPPKYLFGVLVLSPQLVQLQALPSLSVPPGVHTRMG